MVNSIALRRALAVAVPTAVGAVIAQMLLEPRIKKGLKVR